MTTDSTFEWPCDRRDAHHGHDVPVCTCAMTESSLHSCAVHGDQPGDESRWCRGVGAHPSTMIGGSHADERPDYLP